VTTHDPAVYRKAADDIRKKGLKKGSFTGLDGSHCTMGALMHVTDNPHLLDLDDPYIITLSDMIGFDPDNVEKLARTQFIAVWNDKRERTVWDVVGLLEQAAEKAEADR
jgi:hypothetical protein